MKFKIDGDLLLDAVRSVQRLTQAKDVTLKVEKNFVKVMALFTSAAASMTVPIEMEEKSKNVSASCSMDALSSSLTKRKDLVIEITDSMIKITQVKGRYSAEIVAHQGQDETVIPEEAKADTAFKFKDSFLKAIFKLLPKLELKPLVSSGLMNNFAPIGIKATKTGTFISCFDHIQSAFVMDESMKGNFEFTLPSNIFSLVTRETKGQAYQLSVTEAQVYAWNEVFELSLALPQAEGEQVLLQDMIDLYENKIKKLKNPFSVKLKTAAIKDMFENAKAFYETESTFKFAIKGNKCKLTLQSSFGKIDSGATLEKAAKEDKEFICDFMFFSTILSKAPAEIELFVIDDSAIMFNSDPVTYLMSLT